MYKGKCIHPGLNNLMVTLGHTQSFCVVDSGFPISKEVDRIDLGWKEGSPSLIEVCKLIKEEMSIEKIFLTNEFKLVSPDIYKEFVNLFNETPIELVSHEELKVLSTSSVGIVRTGEFSSYANCIFVAGVNF